MDFELRIKGYILFESTGLVGARDGFDMVVVGGSIPLAPTNTV
jgi:hypothetical protein